MNKQLSRLFDLVDTPVDKTAKPSWKNFWNPCPELYYREVRFFAGKTKYVLRNCGTAWPEVSLFNCDSLEELEINEEMLQTILGHKKISKIEIIGE